MLSRLSSPRTYHTASTMRTTASMATTAVVILNDVVMHCNHVLTLNNHRPRTHQQRHLQYHRLVELLHHHDVHKCIADRWPHETTIGCIASQRYASMHAPKLTNYTVTRFYICWDSTVPGEQRHRLTSSDFQTVCILNCKMFLVQIKRLTSPVCLFVQLCARAVLLHAKVVTRETVCSL